MKFKIGFKGYEEEKNEDLQLAKLTESKPVKSVVQVRFPSQGRSFAYYNDQFDLQVGDIVFVEGKLEGVQGVVTEVSRTFKIKLSDYKRVISLADTRVEGTLYFGGSHMIAFDEDVIPFAKIRDWFLPPENEDDFAVGFDNEDGFFFDDFEDFDIRPEIAHRGADYYKANKVVYLSLCGEKGRAIVMGTKAYEVTFDMVDGEIGNLTCGCFCSYHCKHEFAVLLQLRETIQHIEKYYQDKFKKSNYFAAISRDALLSYAKDYGKKGNSILEK